MTPAIAHDHKYFFFSLVSLMAWMLPRRVSKCPITGQVDRRKKDVR